MSKQTFVAVVIIAAVALILLLPRPQAAVAGGGVFFVDSTGDESDNNLGDCRCATAGGTCTLRAAIQEANACPGHQIIRFDGAGQWMTIRPGTALPALTDDETTIDGGDMWQFVGDDLVPGVILDGNGQAFSGLEIQGDNCQIFGLEIINFGHNGILVEGSHTMIGGGGDFLRNVVSRNGWNGILITGDTATDNRITGNYVGTNPIGTADEWGGVSDWGNGNHGISVWNGDRNIVEHNVVGTNGWSGITADAAQDVTFYANRIGVDIAGQPIGNRNFGVHIGNGANVTMTNNLIEFNQRGVYVTGTGSRARIEANTIGGNDATSASPPTGGGILVNNGAGATILENDILANIAESGGGIAVSGSGTWASIASNLIQANRVVTSAPPLGGGIYVEDAIAVIAHNEIANNNVDGTGGMGGGILFRNVSWGFVVENEIHGNWAASSDAVAGLGIYVWGGGGIQITGNRIEGNGYGSIGAVCIDNADDVTVGENLIVHNTNSAGGAVFVHGSSNILLENNVIAHNIYDAGLYIHDSTGWTTVKNNTIANNSEDGIGLYHAQLALYNTIIASNGGYGVYDRDAASNPSSIGIGHNDVWGNDSGPTNRADVHFYLGADPHFFDAANDQYGLRTGSLCIDTALSAYAPSGSYNGLSRPQGDGPDIGAYEMAPPTFLPLVLRND